MRQGSVLQQSSGGQVNSVELTGPIMPHCIAGLARLFTHTSRGDFTATFGAVHEPTLSLNCMSLSDDMPQPADYQHLIPSDVCHVDHLGKQAMRELVCTDRLYTWTCWWLMDHVGKQAMRELVCTDRLYTWTCWWLMDHVGKQAMRELICMIRLYTWDLLMTRPLMPLFWSFIVCGF